MADLTSRADLRSKSLPNHYSSPARAEASYG
nr:MAG TPA: hypothetical protein [Caudoviricetes sp.]